MIFSTCMCCFGRYRRWHSCYTKQRYPHQKIALPSSPIDSCFALLVSVAKRETLKTKQSSNKSHKKLHPGVVYPLNKHIIIGKRSILLSKLINQWKKNYMWVPSAILKNWKDALNARSAPRVDTVFRTS